MMRRGKSGRNGLLPNSLRIISSCLKTVSSNAGSVASTVRSAGASVAASLAVPPDDVKDQVLWAGFDKLELSSSLYRNVLLLGYSNGFQVLDVEDASNVHELVSRRDGPVTFLQMQPIPAELEGPEGFRSSHPMLLVVAGDDSKGSDILQGGRFSTFNDGCNDSTQGTCVPTPTVVRFFSLRSSNIVHVLRFRSAVYVVRCSPRIVAVALGSQIYCFDAVTLENKFSVLTYPMQIAVGLSVGYGPMALGPRWLAYASNNPLLSNTGRVSPQNLTPSPGVSPSTSPGTGSLVARYAMESSKQLAAGIMNLGDMGYKTISKYCQDLLPDGSSSPMSSSGRRMSKLAPSTHHSEADNAGMVVIKDFISKDVISQFRAHTSPISALCFDPTGTLLVTASIHGNNINVFRIMPTSISNGSSSARYDWTSSHVHLYKLYRGLTTAVIQDISFSHNSQWISIVSSRGTCHLYVLCPFGGDTGLQSHNLHGDGSNIMSNLSLPWWSTSSYMIDHRFLSPPATITLSVVGRIKNGSSRWLNTVGTVAASATGKLHVPSGAVAAVFHNSLCHNFQKTNLKPHSLEQLLVYSPSGHVIQYELLPSLFEVNAGSGPHLQIQDDELQVIAEPVQWWDVCRRLNWPERDGCIPGVILGVHDSAEMTTNASDLEENDINYIASSTNSVCGKNSVKAHERPSWYLSNAEIRGNYGQIPIWQKSKICFYMIKGYHWVADDSFPGEIEIEKLTVHEVEIRQKDPLPVFHHFHGVQSDWHDRNTAGGRYLAVTSAGIDYNRDILVDDTDPRDSTISKHCSESSKTAGGISELEKLNPSRSLEGLQSVEEPDCCEFDQNSNFLGHSLGKADDEYRGFSIPKASQAKPDVRTALESSHQDIKSFPSKSAHDVKVVDDCSADSFPLENGFLSVYRQTSHSQNGPSSDVFIGSETIIYSPQTLEFPHYLKEGYCKLSKLDDSHDSAEAVTDVDSNSSHCEREKLEEDEDNDDMLEGVFAFSEEG